MITNDRKTFFAPELFVNNGVKDISFYKRRSEHQSKCDFLTMTAVFML